MNPRWHGWLIVGVIMLGRGFAAAYENACTHPELTRKANVLIRAERSRHDELDGWLATISYGTYIEDLTFPPIPTVPEFAVLNHFYNPRNRKGLTLPGITSILTVPALPALVRGRGQWDEAVANYKHGNKSGAYVLLGHTLHLMTQDLAQPAHVHNDPHISKNKFADKLNYSGLKGVDSSHLEKAVEVECDANLLGRIEGSKIPIGDAHIRDTPLQRLLGGSGQLEPEDLGEELARLTYRSAVFDGFVPSNGQLLIDNLLQIPHATGRVNVRGREHRVDYVLAENPLSFLCLNRAHWALLGNDRVLCYDPETTYDGSGPDFTNDWWRIPADGTYWAEFYGNENKFYIDKPNYVKTVSNITLTEDFTIQLLPKAVEYSARLMTLFAETVDPIFPSVSAHEKQAGGAPISPSGETSANIVYVEATDPVDAAHPVPSGIYRLVLTQVAGGRHSSTSTFDEPILINQPNVVSASFLLPKPGDYVIEAWDGFGHGDNIRFSYKLPPQASIAPVGHKKLFNARTAAAPNTLSRFASIDLTSSRGLASVSVAGPSGIVTPTSQVPANPVGAMTLSARVENLTPGTYVLSAEDAAGKITKATWSVENLDIYLSTESSSVFNPLTGEHEGTVVLGFKGTQDLFQVDQLDPQSRQVRDKVPLSGGGAERVYTVNTSRVYYPTEFNADITTRYRSPNNVEVVNTFNTDDIEPIRYHGLDLVARDTKGDALMSRFVIGDIFNIATENSWMGNPDKPLPWEPAPDVFGVQESPIYDTFDGAPAQAFGVTIRPALLPGAVIQLGDVRDALTGTEMFHSVKAAIPEVITNGSITRPVDFDSCDQIIGHVDVDYYTADTLAELATVAPVRVMNADVDVGIPSIDGRQYLPPEGETTITPNANLPIKRYFKFVQNYQKFPPDVICSFNCFSSSGLVPGDSCSGPNREPVVDIVAPLIAGQVVVISSSPLVGTPAGVGANQSFPIGVGLEASGVDVTQFGTFTTGISGEGEPERGFKNIAGGAAYFLGTSPSISKPITLTAGFNAADVNPEQKALARALRITAAGARSRLSAAVAGNSMSFTALPSQAKDPDVFVLAAPDYENPVVTEVGPLQIVADMPGVSASIAAPTAISSALNYIQAQGLWLAGPVYQLASSTGILDPPGVLRLTYDPQTLSAKGLNADSLALLRFNASGTFQFLDSQLSDPVNKEVTAELNELSTYAALFGRAPQTTQGSFLTRPTAPTPPPVPSGTVDTAAPRTSLLVEGPAITSSTIFASGVTVFSLTAADDFSSLNDNLGVGVAQTQLAIDSPSYDLYAGTFSITTEGVHALSFYSVDSALNTELTRSATIAIDITAPETVLVVQGSSATGFFGDLVFTATAAITLTAVDPASNGGASGVAGVFYVIDEDPLSPDCASQPVDTAAPPGTCANSAYVGAFRVAPGTHSFTFYAEDRVGNRESPKTVFFTVLFPDDIRPARTSLIVGTPSHTAGTVYATAATTFGVAAVDDLTVIGDGLGHPSVRFIISLDGAPQFEYTGTPFSFLTEGAHTAALTSVDVVGNVETEHVSNIALDSTSPQSALVVNGASGTDENGFLLISSMTALSISAVDPLSGGVASGVGGVYVAVDQNSPACGGTAPSLAQPLGACAGQLQPSTFTLLPGAHTLYFLAKDNVGNAEILHITSVTVRSNATDVLPPRSYLVGGLLDISTNTFNATADTSLELIFSDDWEVVGDQIGVGSTRSYVSIDDGDASLYTGTFSITSEGLHRVGFYSVDLAMNISATDYMNVGIDTTPSQASLGVLRAGTTELLSSVVVSSMSPLTIFATDPLSGGVQSFVGRVL